MKSFNLNNSSKLLLSTDDIANLLSINKESAKVTASRYAKKGLLIRIKKDTYMLPAKFESLKEEGLFRLANIIQTPSYISFTTALSYYEITTQQLRNFIESAALKRTKSVSIKNVDFTFTLIKKELYTGFELKENFFIALPEKALTDTVYLTALGRYNCDFESIDFNKIDKKKVEVFLKKTNDKTKSYWKQLCKTYNL
jgi:predicted transcriptional regulator of viral defense system